MEWAALTPKQKVEAVTRSGRARTPQDINRLIAAANANPELGNQLAGVIAPPAPEGLTAEGFDQRFLPEQQITPTQFDQRFIPDPMNPDGTEPYNWMIEPGVQEMQQTLSRVLTNRQNMMNWPAESAPNPNASRQPYRHGNTP